MKWRRVIRWAAWTLVGLSFLIWLATGRAVHTRYHDSRRAAFDTGQREDAALWPGGDQEESPLAYGGFPNRFMLGLLPSGGGKYLLSVFSLVAVGVAIELVGYMAGMSRRHARKADGDSVDLD